MYGSLERHIALDKVKFWRRQKEPWKPWRLTRILCVCKLYKNVHFILLWWYMCQTIINRSSSWVWCQQLVITSTLWEQTAHANVYHNLKEITLSWNFDDTTRWTLLPQHMVKFHELGPRSGAISWRCGSQGPLVPASRLQPSDVVPF